MCVTLPNSSSIHATHSGEMKINALPIQARSVYVFSQLKISLILISNPEETPYGYNTRSHTEMKKGYANTT